MVVAYVPDNYKMISTFNKAYVNGKPLQIVVVDELEGGLHSSQALGVSGAVAIYIPTASHVTIRMSLYAYCNAYRVFEQDPGKALKCKGNLEGFGYDFIGQSSDAGKDPLKHLLSETTKAIAKGLTGA